MHFQFSDFNHCDIGKRSIEDLILIMSAQLEALGHTVNCGHVPYFVTGSVGINVLFESFADNPNTISEIAKAHAQGCHFVYVATEEPTLQGFNGTTDQGMIDRQNAFPNAAKYARAVLHLVPGVEVTRWYGQFAPASPIELGYADSLIRDEGIEPEFDFGFYGQMSERREKMLDAFRKIGSVLVCPDIELHQVERDIQMQRAKVILQIRRFDQMGLVSSSRCNTALSIGRPVVAEPHGITTGWEQVVHFSTTIDGFFKEALAISRHWRYVYPNQLMKFKQMFSPQTCLGEPLRSVGIT